MTYKMSEFQDIDPGHVVKLREAGIESTDDMMRIWADQPKRAALVEGTGIDLDRFTNLASMARLARVKNVGPKFVGVLLAAGIDGPKSLFEHTPEALVKRLGEIAVEKKMSSPVPTLEEVGPWFTDPKPVAAVVL
jgi:hypothetical protein